MKNIIIIALVSLSLAACNGQNNTQTKKASDSSATSPSVESTGQQRVAPEPVADDTTVQSDRMSNTYRDSSAKNSGAQEGAVKSTGASASDSGHK